MNPAKVARRVETMQGLSCPITAIMSMHHSAVIAAMLVVRRASRVRPVGQRRTTVEGAVTRGVS